MPLPNDATLSLQKYTNPADSSQTEPLQAMMVRMTTETFEALEKQDKPHMQIQFGSDGQAIMINGISYPFQLSTDTSPHEIYLRMAQPTKPNAPLRLFANVTAKLAVQRDISQVQEQIRGKAIAAEKQRNERQVIVLDKPLPPTKPPPKRKDARINRKTANTDLSSQLTAPSSSLPTRVHSPRPPSASPPPSNPALRARLIDIVGHIPHATHKLILDYLGIGMLDEERPRRSEVQAHLREIGTYVKTEADKIGEWKLYPELRSQMSREPPRKEKRRLPTEGKVKKAPRPSDPVTSRDGRASSLRVDTLKFKERETDDLGSPGTPTSARSGAAIPTRRPGSGYKAPKTGSITPDTSNPSLKRASASDAHVVKREAPSPSLTPTARPTTMHERTPSNTSTSAARIQNRPKDTSASAVRNASSSKYDHPESPAPLASSTSGTKRKKVPPPEYDDYSDRDGPSNSISKKRRLEEGSSSTLKSKDRGRDDYKERDLSLPKKPAVHQEASPRPAKTKREASPYERERERPSRASPVRRARSPLPDRQREKDRESVRERDRDRERERENRDRERESRDRERERDRDRDRDRDRERERDRDRDRDREDRVVSSSSTEHRQRADNGGGAVSQRSSGSAKPRRKSPTYTSSEDERESSTHIAARSGVPPPSSTASHTSKMDVDVDMEMSSSSPPAHPPSIATHTVPTSTSSGAVAKSLPKDPEMLQRLYRSKYPKYIQLYWTAKSAKDLLEDALDRTQYDTPDSDLDADAGVMSLDELSELKVNLETTSAELQKIKAAYLSHTGMELDERDVDHVIKEERD